MVLHLPTQHVQNEHFKGMVDGRPPPDLLVFGEKSLFLLVFLPILDTLVSLQTRLLEASFYSSDS